MFGMADQIQIVISGSADSIHTTSTSSLVWPNLSCTGCYRFHFKPPHWRGSGTYHIAGKFGKSSAIRQTKIIQISTYN